MDAGLNYSKQQHQQPKSGFNEALHPLLRSWAQNASYNIDPCCYVQSLCMGFLEMK